MPYDSNDDLPDPVRNVLPEHAQTIYRKAFNNAWDQYADPEDRTRGGTREEAAHRVAWAAVKHEYEKGEEGKWHRKAGGKSSASPRKPAKRGRAV
jgi:cation transport regulator